MKVQTSPKLLTVSAVLFIVVAVVVAVLFAFIVIPADNLGTRFLHLAFILIPTGAVMLLIGVILGLIGLNRNGFSDNDDKDSPRGGF